uniref:TSA: Wollemia nobilis Ref_Wollemi_Transcript_15714_1015 transcribed RNA sequence n=1 Tax=Wollemia nobilis TaxID=56998 RepID=A0A0C9RIP4_9CONI
MLAVFNRSVVDGPEELVSPRNGGPDLRKNDKDLVQHFVSTQPNTTSLKLDTHGVMAYTHHNQGLLMPRSFGVVDDVFCVFVGALQNLALLRQEYGLRKNVDEVMLAIEAFKALRDRGPFPADQVLHQFEGHFAFVLFDSNSGTVLATRAAEGKCSLFWGRTSDGSLAFSDNDEVLKSGCGTSFAPFPAGCYFSSMKGLQSYEHPLNNMKAMPRVDSKGQMCGATFVVDSSKKASIPHVSSEANWSQDI